MNRLPSGLPKAWRDRRDSVRSTGQCQFSYKISHFVGRLGLEVRISVSFQIFALIMLNVAAFRSAIGLGFIHHLSILSVPLI